MIGVFENPIAEKKVRNGIYAHRYRNGCINIEGQQYHFYSMTDAIKKFRQDFPAYHKK